MELQAAGVLTALAVAVFASQRGIERAALAVLLTALVVTSLAVARLGALDVSALAFCIVAASATALARPSWKWLPPIATGVVAAGWISILQAQGLPWLPAAFLAGSVLATASVLAARRAGFAPAEMRDEALVIVGLFALLLAVGPDVADGWRAATALTAEPLAAEGREVGTWWGALALGCVLSGGVYSLWKRR